MIQPLDIYNQIQKYTQVFQFVGLTADFKRILDETAITNIQLPAAFICFKDSTVSSSDVLTSFYGVEEIDISVFVVLSDVDDLTGSDGMTQNITSAVSDLKKCLMGWVPNNLATIPMSYEGYSYIDMTGSKIIYETRFSLEQQLTQETDGFVPDYDTLQEIDADVKYYKDGNIVYENNITIN